MLLIATRGGRKGSRLCHVTKANPYLPVSPSILTIRKPRKKIRENPFRESNVSVEDVDPCLVAVGLESSIK